MLVSAYKSFTIEDSRLHVGVVQARTTWLKANTVPSAIVMTEAPETDFLYSGRRTIRQPQSLASAAELEGFLVEHSVDYILIAPRIKWQPSYIPTYSNETTYILSLMAELVSEGRITLVYSSERDLVKVFKP